MHYFVLVNFSWYVVVVSDNAGLETLVRVPHFEQKKSRALNIMFSQVNFILFRQWGQVKSIGPIINLFFGELGTGSTLRSWPCLTFLFNLAAPGNLIISMI